MNPVMARTSTDKLRIDSAGGETGSKIDRFCSDAPALVSSNAITRLTPVLECAARHTGSHRSMDHRLTANVRVRPVWRRGRQRCRSRSGLGSLVRRLPEEQRCLAVQADLNNVWPKEEGKRPLDDNAKPPAPTRHLQQVI